MKTIRIMVPPILTYSQGNDTLDFAKSLADEDTSVYIVILSPRDGQTLVEAYEECVVPETENGTQIIDLLYLNGIDTLAGISTNGTTVVHKKRLMIA